MDIKTQITIYRQAIEVVREKLRKLEDQIEQLKAVERFHADEIKWCSVFEGDQIEPRGVAAMSQADAAASILRECGEALTPLEIARRMVEVGFPIPNGGLDRLRKSITGTMPRKPKLFESIGDGRWRIREHDVE